MMALYSCSSRSLSLSSSSQSSLEEVITDATTILTIQAEAVKEKGPVAHFSVCLSVFRLSQQSRSVWTIPLALESLHRSMWLLLLFHGRHSTNVSYTIRISPFTACFLLIHRFIKPVPYWASTPVQTVPSRHTMFHFVFTLTLQTLPCPAVLARVFEPV